MGNYAGVDWATEKHDVIVQNEAGEELVSASFAHDEDGLRLLCRTLVRMKVALVAIERPDGLLVERLLDGGLRLLALEAMMIGARQLAQHERVKPIRLAARGPETRTRRRRFAKTAPNATVRRSPS